LTRNGRNPVLFLAVSPMIHFFEVNKNRNWFCLLLIVLFCFVTFLLPILLWGIPSGLDLETDMRFTVAYLEGFKSWNFAPIWSNDGSGFGSVGIRFYPPIPFFALAITQLATNDWFTSLSLNLFGWMILGCAGVYFFAKEWATPNQAMVGGMIYAIVPQHLNEIFQFVLYAEFAAWGILPFCFLFITRVCRHNRWIDAIGLAVSCSFLVLTHIPTSIIAILVFPIYAFLLIDSNRIVKITLKLSAAFISTMVATAFRWLNIAFEVNWLAHNDSKYSHGAYQAVAWLFPTVLTERSLSLLLIGSWICDITVVLTLILLVPSILLLLGRVEMSQEVKKFLIAAVITALFSLFMLSRPSSIIWETFTFLQKIQFPWRWLSVFSLLTVVSLIVSISVLISAYQGIRRFIVYPILVIVVAVGLFDYTQLIVPAAPYTTEEFGKIVSELETKPIWEGWWPIWAKKEAFDDPTKINSEDRTVQVTQWEPENREFVVSEGKAINIRIATFYYPYWKATVNDSSAEVSMDDNGSILIPIPSDASKVQLYFEEPSYYRIAKFISAVAWMCIGCYLGLRILRKLNQRRKTFR
jgi:hypothetical protein